MSAWPVFSSGQTALEPLMGLDAVPPSQPSRVALLWHSDGAFYGTSVSGGDYGQGTIFRLSTAGQMNWLSFSGYDDGSKSEGPLPGNAPRSDLVLGPDGWLWGTTSNGGPVSLNGTVFKTQPGTWDTQIVVAFSGASGPLPGKAPYGGLTRVGDRWLWGTTREGGAGALGSLYRVDALTGACREMLTFTGTEGAAPGAAPEGRLYADATGNLWGTTTAGGSFDSGVIFKYQISTGTFTVIAALAGNHTGVKGRKPAMGLTPDGTGRLWGVAEQSGAGSAGALFRVNMAAGTAETVFEFSGNATATSPGSGPIGPLVHDSAGFLWGAASAGGVGARGTVFKVNQATGAVTVAVQFGSLTGVNSGLSTPVSGLTKDDAGYLWGIAQPSGAGARAVVYKVKISDGSFTRVADYGTRETPLRGQTPGPVVFDAANEWLWGTTETGGQFGHGTIYRYHPLTKAVEVKVHFTGTSGAAPGSLPRGRLKLNEFGEVWGVTQFGGASNFGTVFKYVPDTVGGGIFTSVLAFDTAKGVWPMGSLADSFDGWLWGTTEGSVSNEFGSVFKINRTSGEFVTVHRFTDRNLGATPAGGLVWSSDGMVGMTTAGGSTAGGQLLNHGTIFQIVPSTGAHSVLLAFTGADGSAPGYGLAGELMPVYFIGGDTHLWGSTLNHVFRFKLQSREFQKVLPRFLPLGGTYPKQVGTAVFRNGYYPVCLGLEQTRDSVTLQTSLRRVIYAFGSAATLSPPFAKQLTLAEDATLATLPDQPLVYSSVDDKFYGTQRTGQMESRGSGTAGGLLFAVHQKEFLPGRSPSHPALATRAVVSGGSEVNGTVATLRGLVDANVTHLMSGAVVLGASTRSMTSTGPLTSLTAVDVGTLVSSSRSLAPHTTYFYRSALIQDDGEPIYGGLRCLMTGAAAPVSGPALSVESPPGTLAGSALPISFGSSHIGITKTQAVTLRNLGDDALTGIAVRLEEGTAGTFTLTMNPDRSSLAGADNTTGLLISFTPQAEGDSYAQLVITSNDPDEPELYVTLIGTGVGTPNLVVENSAGGSLASGATLDLGNVEIDYFEPTTRTLTLRNTGNGTFHADHLVIEDDELGLFTSDWQGALQLPPGEATSIELSFSTSETGLKTARFVIAGTSESPRLFTLNLSVMGVAIPHLQLLYYVDPSNLATVEKGVTRVPFGKATVGQSEVRQFSLSNSGSGSLTGLQLEIPAGAPFSLVGPLPTTLLPWEEATIEIQFQPTEPGDFDVPVSLRSNDPNDDPFPFFLTGISPGPTAPRIVTQLQSQWARAGAAVSLSPEVRGSRPMLWEWRVAGKVVPTETDAEYHIPAAAASHAASYQFTVRNQIGTPAVSQMAWLGVVTPAPQRAGVKLGGTLNLRCLAAVPKATGVSVKYRWRRGDEPLSNGALPSGAVVSGADKADLKITKMTDDDGLDYDCEVTLVTPGGEHKTLHGETLVDVLTEVPVIDPPELGGAIPFGSAVDVQLSASHTPSSFSAKGLPAGLRLDAATGRITGRPTAASRVDAKTGEPVPFKILLRATNAIGTGPAHELLLVVTDHFAPLAASYFVNTPRHDATNFSMGGQMQLTVTRTGVGSGVLILAGQRHPFTAPLIAEEDGASAAGIMVERKPAHLGPLSLDLEVTEGAASAVIRDRQWRGQPEQEYSTYFIAPKSADADHDHGLDITFQTPRGLAFDREGNLYLADTGNHTIHRHLVWEDEYLYGETLGESGVSGSADGSEARFHLPEALVIDPRGVIQIADTGNAALRSCPQTGIVSTLAGAAGQMGHVDGTGAAARFRAPCGITADPAGNLYVTDRLSHVIRKVTPAGVVTTLAGKPDVSGHKDGSGKAALFDSPNAITYDPVQDALFVADTENHVIRRVTLAGAVTTWIGSPKVPGQAPGLQGLARLTRPRGITTDGRGNLFFTAGSFWQANRAGLAMPIMPEFNPTEETPELALSSLAVDPVTDDLAFTHEIAGFATRLHLNEAEESFQAIGFSLTTALSPHIPELAGLATVAFIQSPVPGVPVGSGFATLTISNKGAVTATGKMADGATFTSSGNLDAYIGVSMHSMLSKNSASLEFTVNMFADSPEVVANALWRKLPQPLSGGDLVHRTGFETLMEAMAGRYQKEGGIHAFLGLTESPAAMTFNATGEVFDGITQPFELNAPSTVRFPPFGTLNPADVQLTFTPATGLFTGSFKSGTPARTTSFSGVLVNSIYTGSLGGYGYFHYPESDLPGAPTISGAITLDPF